MNNKILFLVFFLFGVSSLVLAQLELPPGLQKGVEQTLTDAQKLSFLVVFLGGILSLFSPCILPTLPAFFAYSFKEKKNLTKMTFIFFLGFALVFIILGIIAAALGLSLVQVQENFDYIILIAGIILILFGILTFLGKGFTFIKIARKAKSDTAGVFLLGVFFAIGFSPCVGPIIGAVLVIATTLHNYFYSALLFFVYSLGVLVPLFLLAFFYDKYNLGEKKWIQGKEVKIGNITTHSTKIIAGILLIIIGLIFIFFKGTNFVNKYDPTGTKQLFFDWQRALIGNTTLAVIGGIVLVAFIIFLFFALKKKNDKK